MRRQYVREPAVVRSKRAYRELHVRSAGDDSLLLPVDREVARIVPIFPSQELKFYDCYNENVNLNMNPIGTGSMILAPLGGGLISTPPVGDSGSNRCSKTIVIKNWRLTGLIYKPYEAVKLFPPFAMYVFVCVVLDTQVNGTGISDSDVWSNPASNLDHQFPPFRNMSNSSRFQVLKSDVFKIDPVSFTIDTTSVPAEYSWAGSGFNFDWFVPADFSISFNGGTSASVSSVLDRGLYIMACQSGGHQMSITWKSRIRFYDM